MSKEVIWTFQLQQTRHGEEPEDPANSQEKDPRSMVSFIKSELFLALTTLMWVSGFHTETNLKVPHHAMPSFVP